MIGAKAIVLPFFEFLAPYKPGQPLYLIPERASLLCLAEVIIARDSDTGEELPVWGTEEYERLKAGESTVRGPVLVVELSFANELEDLLDVVASVQGGSDLEDDDEEEEPADNTEEAEDDEDLDDEDEEGGDLEDADDDFDDDWDEVGDDEEDDAEDEEEEEADEV